MNFNIVINGSLLKYIYLDFASYMGGVCRRLADRIYNQIELAYIALQVKIT